MLTSRFSCQRYATKYCSKCFNYFCNSCGIKESEKDEHYVVDIESMDKVCFEHNDSANIYCPIEKKSICDFCNVTNICYLQCNKCKKILCQKCAKICSNDDNHNYNKENENYQLVKEIKEFRKLCC